MTTSRIIDHGSGTAQVTMINNGFLRPSVYADWYDTTRMDPIQPPVLCFVIEKDGKKYLWDMGIRKDFMNLQPHLVASFKAGPPIVTCAMPADLPANLLPIEAVYLSHYHWDHCGDAMTVPEGVPIYTGVGTKAAIEDGGIGIYVGPSPPEVMARLQDLPEGTLKIEGFPGLGYDVFGDGSFVVVPAPGHCPGHSIAVVRTTSNPDTYMFLGGDSGHHRSLYDPCPCHQQVAEFSIRRPIHRDPENAKLNLQRLSHAHGRDDCWVVVAHEGEVERSVPQNVVLNDWREKGWKDKVNALREEENRGREEECYANAKHAK